jgi:beta-carotene 3-hydroxylase
MPKRGCHIAEQLVIRTFMFWLSGFAIFMGTILAMEVFAYVTHRWVMHGFGWFLHESHHRARTGFWELNDLYFVIFATPSIILLIGGTSGMMGNWATWVGAGIAGYGAIYLGFHDIIVHKRWKTRYIPKSDYMKRIIQAHRLHHVVETKDGTVSFGFLWAPKPEVLKAQLQARGMAGVREPARTFGD